MESLNPETNLLADDYKRPLVYATTGQRFVNYLVDVASFYLFAMVFGIVLVLVTGNPTIVEDADNSAPLLTQVISIVLYGVYMGVIEGLGRGKTLGKLFTRTRAVNEDGTRIRFSTAFLRGLSRAVPFEALSAFNAYPWHDQWTKTRVVKEESLPEQNS